MEQITEKKIFLGYIIILQVVLCHHLSFGADCIGLSTEVTCTCDDFGHCARGTVQIDPWLQNTLRTQVEVQLDLPFNHAQLLDSHNSFNTRPYGILYGANDTCTWPPPYSSCTGIANQEFSLTDLLNMGVRGIELDNWYCEDEMRIAHLGVSIAHLCSRQHVLFCEPVAEIGAWLDEHPGEFIRIYMNEKSDQGNDEEINGPFERYLGERVLTPADLRDTYNNEWPTLRTMRAANKTVVIAHLATAGTDDFYLHQGKFIHPGFWKDKKRVEFTNYPECGGKNDTNALRFYSDSTYYQLENLNLFNDGPTRVGIIDDFTEFVKCGIQYPGGDQLHPQIMETAAYTWAKGEPATLITDSMSCIMLNGTNNRWYTPTDCTQDLYYACQNPLDTTDWTLSESAGGYDVNTQACPSGYWFALPQNGYQHQKMLEAINGTDVWLNVAPLLPDYQPDYQPPSVPGSVPPPSDDDGRATAHSAVISLIIIAVATSVFIL